MENEIRKRIGCVLIVSSTMATACGGGLEGPPGGSGGASGGSGGGSGGYVGTGGWYQTGTGGAPYVGLPPCDPSVSAPYCPPIGVPCDDEHCGLGGAGGEGGSTTAIGIK